MDALTIEDKMKAFDNIKSRFVVEGGRLELVIQDRYDEVKDTIANFFIPDEPLGKPFDVRWNKEVEKNVTDGLIHNMSIMAISNETDEVMGVRLCEVMRRTDFTDLGDMKYDNLRDLFRFLKHKDKEIDFYNVFNVDEAVHMLMLAVNSKFRRRGLGTILMAAMVALCKELGYKAIKGEGTSHFSQRIYEKQNFRILCELPYDTYLHNGEPIGNKTGEHKRARIYGMSL